MNPNVIHHIHKPTLAEAFAALPIEEQTQVAVQYLGTKVLGKLMEVDKAANETDMPHSAPDMTDVYTHPLRVALAPEAQEMVTKSISAAIAACTED